ncbi:hypothetical protein D3C87_925340 [compost metagenome]
MGLGGDKVPDGLIIAPEGELATTNAQIKPLADEIQFPITSEPNRCKETNLHGLILCGVDMRKPHLVTGGAGEMERTVGVEPTLAAWKAVASPRRSPRIVALVGPHAASVYEDFPRPVTRPVSLEPSLGCSRNAGDYPDHTSLTKRRIFALGLSALPDLLRGIRPFVVG